MTDRGCTPFCKGPCSWDCPNFMAALREWAIRDYIALIEEGA